jgi:hypothetical protein
MSKISFEDLDKAPAESNTEKTETAVVVKPDLAIAAPPIADPAKGLLGEWTAQDTRLPRLNLVNKSGDLANTFVPGTYVINKEHQLNQLSADSRERSNPISVIVATMAKQYQENIPFDQREQTPARLFNRAADVIAAQGTISRLQGEGKFSEIAHVELFVEQPEGISEDAEALFYYTFGGKKYTRVIWTVSGTAFGAVAVTIASALRGHLASTGLVGGQWLLGSSLIKGAKNSWWQPTIRTSGLVEPEVVKEIEGNL